MENESSNFWEEFVKLIFISVLIVVPFRLLIAQPFIVDGASMDPTFETGDYLIVDQITYRFDKPLRGSILVFKYPENPKKSFIKRVIGLPGEKVSIASGEVTIFNEEHPEGFRLDEPYIEFEKIETKDFTLGDEEYFVMGDNRKASADSRVWGPVPEENIVGRPVIRLLPPGLFPGRHTEYLEVTE